MNQQSNQSNEFEGHCAFALTLGKKDVMGKKSIYLIKDGKKYLFSNPVAKLLFRVLPGRLKKAESNWSA